MATMAVPGDGDFGIELCKILGLDPKKTKNIILICKSDSAVMIQTTSYLQENETGDLLRLIGKYNLTKEENEINQTKL